MSTLRTWASKFLVDEGILYSVLTLMKSKGKQFIIYEKTVFKKIFFFLFKEIL